MNKIDELARPDGAATHRTGAIYSFKGPTDGPVLVRAPGEWNDYEIIGLTVRSLLMISLRNCSVANGPPVKQGRSQMRS